MSEPRSKKHRPKGDYAVGYCRPPAAGRFQKGCSGNPKGRPRKNTTVSAAIEAELARSQRVQLNGKRIIATKAEIIAIQLIKQAMEGKPRAITELMRYEPKSLKKALASAAEAEGEGIADEPLSPTERDIMRWYLESTEVQEAPDAPRLTDGEPDGEGDEEVAS